MPAGEASGALTRVAADVIVNALDCQLLGSHTVSDGGYC